MQRRRMCHGLNRQRSPELEKAGHSHSTLAAEQARLLLADATSSLHCADVFKDELMGFLRATVRYDEVRHAVNETTQS